MKIPVNPASDTPDRPRANPADAARDLEAYFLRHVFQEANVGRSPLGPTRFTGETFAELLQGALADRIAEQGGLGLARAIQNQLGTDSEAFAGHLPIVPVEGSLTSTFGHRQDPIANHRRHHHGVDIAAPYGTPVRSAGAGVVTFAGERGDYGRLVIVRHGEGLETRYAHLGDTLVRPGDRVSAGTPLGRVGDSGRATGPHLHFEVRRGDAPVDPTTVVPGFEIHPEAPPTLTNPNPRSRE